MKLTDDQRILLSGIAKWVIEAGKQIKAETEGKECDVEMLEAAQEQLEGNLQTLSEILDDDCYTADGMRR